MKSASIYIDAGLMKECMEIYVEACCQLGEKRSSGHQSFVCELQLASIRLAIINASSTPFSPESSVPSLPNARQTTAFPLPPKHGQRINHLTLSRAPTRATSDSHRSHPLSILSSSNPKHERTTFEQIHSESESRYLEETERDAKTHIPPPATTYDGRLIRTRFGTTFLASMVHTLRVIDDA